MATNSFNPSNLNQYDINPRVIQCRKDLEKMKSDFEEVMARHVPHSSNATDTDKQKEKKIANCVNRAIPEGPKKKAYNVQEIQEYMKRKKAVEQHNKDSKNVNERELRKKRLEELNEKARKIVSKSSDHSKKNDRLNSPCRKVASNIVPSIASSSCAKNLGTNQSATNLKAGVNKSKPQPTSSAQSGKKYQKANTNITPLKLNNLEPLLPATNFTYRLNPPVGYLPSSAKSDDAKIKAATLIQASYRGHMQRKRMSVPKTGTKIASLNLNNIEPDITSKENVILERGFNLLDDSDPCNFFSSIKRKLTEAVQKTPLKVDAAVQIKEGDISVPSSKSVREAIKKNLGLDEKKQLEIRIKKSQESIRKLQNMNLIENEHLPLTPLTPLSVQRVESMKLKTRSEFSDSDTSNNIPDLSYEGKSLKSALGGSSNSSIKSYSNELATQLNVDAVKNLKLKPKNDFENVKSSPIISPRCSITIASSSYSRAFDNNEHTEEEEEINVTPKMQHLAPPNVQSCLRMKSKFYGIHNKKHTPLRLDHKKKVADVDVFKVFENITKTLKEVEVSKEELASYSHKKKNDLEETNVDFPVSPCDFKKDNILIAENKACQGHSKFNLNVDFVDNFSQSLQEVLALNKSILELDTKEADNCKDIVVIPPQGFSTIERTNCENYISDDVKESPKHGLNEALIIGEGVQENDAQCTEMEKESPSKEIISLSVINNAKAESSHQMKERLSSFEKNVTLSRGSSLGLAFNNSSLVRELRDASLTSGLSILADYNFEGTSINSNVSFNNSSVISEKSQNYAKHPEFMDLMVLDQLIKEEDYRLQHFKKFLHIREQILLDKLELKLSQLNIQKKHLLETGKFQEASAIKKKQRGALIKLQEERNEIKRIKQLEKESSKERKQKLLKKRSVLKAGLGVMQNGTKSIFKRSKVRDGFSGSFRAYSLQSESSVSQQSSGTERTALVSQSKSVVKRSWNNDEFREVTVTRTSHLDLDTVGEFLKLREDQLKKRRYVAEDILERNRKLDEEERKIERLELAIKDLIEPTISSGFLYERPECELKLKEIEDVNEKREDIMQDVGLEGEINKSKITLDEIMQNINDISAEISQLHRLSPTTNKDMAYDFNSFEKATKNTENGQDKRVIVDKVANYDQNEPEVSESQNVKSQNSVMSFNKLESIKNSVNNSISEPFQSDISSKLTSDFQEESSKIRTEVIESNASEDTVKSSSSSNKNSIREVLKVETLDQNLEESILTQTSEEKNSEVEERLSVLAGSDSSEEKNTEAENLLAQSTEDASLCEKNSEVEEKSPRLAEDEPVISNFEAKISSTSSLYKTSFENPSTGSDEEEIPTETVDDHSSDSKEYSAARNYSEKIETTENKEESASVILSEEVDDSKSHSKQIVDLFGVKKSSDESLKEEINSESESNNLIEEVVNKNEENSTAIISINIKSKFENDTNDPLEIEEQIEEVDGIDKSNAEDVPNVPVDVKKRVAEILADASLNSNICEKNPKVADIYVTTYDVTTNDDDDIPEAELPISEDIEELSYSDSETNVYGIGNEAEELLKKQLAIEQEIKQLERQQKHAPLLYVREIPNKPPPPYTPPAQEASPLSVQLIPSSAEQIDECISKLAPIIYQAQLEKTLSTLTIPDAYNEDPCLNLLFDICKQLAIEHYKPFEKVETVLWMKLLEKSYRKKCNENELEQMLCKRVKQLFKFEIVQMREPLLISWSRKKKDLIDRLIYQESLAEESGWFNYEEDILKVKNELTNSILDMLINETLDIVREVQSAKP